MDLARRSRSFTRLHFQYIPCRCLVHSHTRFVATGLQKLQKKVQQRHTTVNVQQPTSTRLQIAAVGEKTGGVPRVDIIYCFVKHCVDFCFVLRVSTSGSAPCELVVMASNVVLHNGEGLLDRVEVRGIGGEILDSHSSAYIINRNHLSKKWRRTFLQSFAESLVPCGSDSCPSL
jgi:hypothetical protein